MSTSPQPLPLSLSHSTFVSALNMPTLFLHFILFLITISVTDLIPAVDSNCIEAQKHSLLHFKKSLVFDASRSSKLITWNSSIDCCSWLGVSCNNTNGRVVGLDLSSDFISSSIDNSSSLFQLQHLQSLNLADNDFNDSSIPSAIGRLTDLRYLNITFASFSGQIPIEISRLTRLVTLALSGNVLSGNDLYFENPDISTLFQNLTELTELYLDSVIFRQGSDWCESISSLLPNLRVLSLSASGLSGLICESLTKLQSLYKIDLRFNSFYARVPRVCTNFPNLTYLSLSNSYFLGTFPKEIFLLPSLQTIDLSDNDDLHGSLPEFPNNGSLRSLNVGWTKFSGALPNSIGNLKMLSNIDLSHCNFTGSVPKSIENLTQLVYLDISGNRFNSPISSIHWENLANLESLHLSNNQLNGTIPSSLFSLSKLESLTLSDNRFSGQLSEFSDTSSSLLDWLHVGNNRLEGEIPTSIFNLQGLQYLDLYSNNFSGFPFNGPHLQPRNLSWVDLSHNSLLFDNHSSNSSSLQIKTLVLAFNKLRSFPDFLRDQITLDISSLDLSGNQIQGEIPNWILCRKSLTYLDLSGNAFVTLETPLPNSSSVLSSLDLRSNQLEGIHSSYSSFLQLEVLSLASNKLKTFPNFLRNQSYLFNLDLSDNQIQGQIPNWIWSPVLVDLNLSCNSLTTLEAPVPNSASKLSRLDLHSNELESIPSSFSFLQLVDLLLSSNKLKTFPDFLRNQLYLFTLERLDLSDNKIQGQIPNWVWRLGRWTSLKLNLSCNAIETLQAPPSNSSYVLSMLDLHSNHLQGQIPLFLSGNYLDYSRNNFNSSIPDNIGDVINAWSYLSLSSSNLHGAIPKSICKASRIVLDLSNNSLSGNIPQCLSEKVDLSVLDLSRNKLTGSIPDNFQETCRLETLKLSKNQIQGEFPKSLVNCSSLVVLNLGNNHITDTFPCVLMSISTLRVLVFRSNKFYGSIRCVNSPNTNGTWPVLQVIDLAHNNFIGDVAGSKFLTWQAMVSNQDDSATNLAYSYVPDVYNRNDIYGRNADPQVYYRDAITTIIKGLELDVVKILTIFTLTDFSSNKFSGSIPEEIGELKSLYVLNLSGNAFTGKIPSSFGQMQQLESLDLSNNHLSGEIPPQIAKLTFLAFLDLSNNELVGKIPTGPQFSTFPNTSFQGNKGLWGPPLTIDALLPPPTSNGSSSQVDSGDEIDWDIISVEIGFTCGFGIAIGSLLFCKRWRKWYYRAMRSVLFKIFPQLEHRFGIHRRHVYINTRH